MPIYGGRPRPELRGHDDPLCVDDDVRERRLGAPLRYSSKRQKRSWGSIDTVGTTARERTGNDGRQMQAVGMRPRHKVYGWRDSAWSKKPTALARLTMVVVGQGMLMARPIMVNVNLRRLKMVVSEAMRCGLAVTKRNSGGRANDAQRI
jgi:hypothetical protein